MHAKVDGQPEKGETVMKLSRALAVVAALVWTCAGGVSAQEWRMDENVFRPVEQFNALPLTARVASASEAPRIRTPRVRPFLTDAYRSAKLRAQQAFERESAAPAAPSAADVGIRAVIIQNRPGLAAADHVTVPRVSPPDTTGAIGPGHYVQMVNSMIAVFDRDLITQDLMNLPDFTGLGGMFEAFDPQILWDQDAQRWFYVALADIPGTPDSNNFAFGWSKTADPTDLVSGWCHYAFATGTRLLDFPKLGTDKWALWIGTNQFDPSISTRPDGFLSAGVLHIRKPARGDIISCGPGPDGFLFFNENFPMLNEDRTMAFAPVVANRTDPNGPFDLFFSGCFIVAAHQPPDGPPDPDRPQNKIMVWRGLDGEREGSPGIIADGDLTVLPYSVPPNVPQPGNIGRLATLETQLTQAVAHVDPDVNPDFPKWAVWTQHTVRGPVVANSVVRFYEIVHSGGSPRNFINRQGEILSATDFVFNGAISPSSRGNDPVIIYNRASQDLLPIVAARTEEPGELILAESVDVDIDSTCDQPPPAIPNNCSWGDYAGATPDPVLPGVVWGTNQFNGPADPDGLPSWRTQIFAVQ
jgi:hypothetical protein